MGRVATSVTVTATVPAAERLWYDLSRWPAFVDGFGHLAKEEGDWPRAGARVVWDSRPGGRGRVVERVVEHREGEGQRVAVEDERMSGEQSVTFAEEGDDVTVALALEYQLKVGGPLQRVVDRLFVRRALGDSLRRTLARFSVELAAEVEPLR
jgi:hypothetical protein